MDTSVGELEYTVSQLRRMDEAAARDTLTVTQYERWERIQDLYEQADETRARWADADETVHDITVEADMEQLGTRVDLYGNDVLVHIDSAGGAFEDRAEAIDDIIGDADGTAGLDDDETSEVLGHLQAMLDDALVEWNGTAWATLPEDTRADVLADAAEKWGAEGLLMAWFDIAEATAEEREAKVSAVESFRNPERRGDR